MTVKNVRALFIPVDGDIELHESFPGHWQVIRDKLDVQVIDVTSTRNASFWVDDEGLLNGSQPNRRASALYWLDGGYLGNVLHGNVLIMGLPDDEGFETDVPDTILKIVEENETMRIRA